MNIYLVERTDGVDYDEYDSFVCVAHDEEEARRIHPSYNPDYYNNELDSPFKEMFFLSLGERFFKADYWVKDICTLDVTYIGETNKYKESKVICASFNAG